MKKSIIAVVIVAGCVISKGALATGLTNGWRFYNMSNTYKITVTPDNMPTKGYVISSKTMSTNIIGDAHTKSFTIKAMPGTEKLEIDKATSSFKLSVLNKDGTRNDRYAPQREKIVPQADLLAIDVSMTSGTGITAYAWTVKLVDEEVKEGTLKSPKKVMINPTAVAKK